MRADQGDEPRARDRLPSTEAPDPSAGVSIGVKSREERRLTGPRQVSTAGRTSPTNGRSPLVTTPLSSFICDGQEYQKCSKD